MGQRQRRRRKAAGKPEPVRVLLKRLRLARGFSQPRLAEKLCEVSGRVTMTRHEVSRWERGERIPGSFWLGWLAVVLDAPLEELEAAVTITQGQLPGDGLTAGQRWLWRPVVAVDLAAALDRGSVHDLRGLAHGWLAGPPAGWDHRRGGDAGGEEPALVDGTGRDVLALLEARLGRLRRADDLLGGVELAGRVDRRLREVIPLVKRIGSGALRNRVLRLVAGYAQLAGWVQADAGNRLGARRAYRVGFKAAAVAGDGDLTAHVLGSLSSLSLAGGDSQEALLLARTGLAGVTGPGGSGSPLLRALLLQRAALAAARTGDIREAAVALVEAERVVDRSKPEEEPEWLYWLDQDELEAMTGRCLAVLGRPLRAVRVLAGWNGRDGRLGGYGSRGSVLYGCWLARSLVAIGEMEEASRVMDRLRVEAAGAGSLRAEAEVRWLRAVVAQHRWQVASGCGKA